MTGNLVSQIVFWTGINAMIVSTVLVKAEPKSRWIYGSGLALAAIGMAIDPDIPTTPRMIWTAVMAALLAAYIAVPALKRRGEERSAHARAEVQQGQGDGVVPEGKGSREDV